MSIKIEFDNNVVRVTLTASKSLMSSVNREYSHNYLFSADIASDVIAKMREFADEFDTISRPRPPDRMQEAPPSQPLAARTSWAVQQIEAIERECPKHTHGYSTTPQGDNGFVISPSTTGLILRCTKVETSWWQGVSITYSLNEKTYDNFSSFFQEIVSYIKTGAPSPPPKPIDHEIPPALHQKAMLSHYPSTPLAHGFVLSAPALETLERFVSVMGL
jgi:hypothetical protein